MLLGIDVSRWQGDMDWQKAASAGVKFAFIRAGSIDLAGKCYIDYQFMRNVSIAPDFMPIGCYWYYRPQFTPKAQAEYFSNLIVGEEWKIPPVADIENYGGLSPAAYANSVKLFLDEVQRLTKTKPIIYTSRYMWSFVEPRPYWPGYDLWVAHYTANTQPLMPEGWRNWRFWQYSSKGNGPAYGAESTYIDLDRFNGDKEAFQEYLGKPFPVQGLLPDNISIKVDIEIDSEKIMYEGQIAKVE